MAVPKKGLGSKGRGLEALISQQVENINDKMDIVYYEKN